MLCGVIQLSTCVQLLLTCALPLMKGEDVLTPSTLDESEQSDVPSVVLSDGAVFDYVVVGAGAAGSAAAARLALIGFDVLLVEAGGDPTLLSKIPSATMANIGSRIDWQYETIPNNVSCLASRGCQCRFSRGKCLGGSTAINYMLYTRGNHRDYDFNVTGWNWEDFKPYFLRYEGLQVLDELPSSSKPYHNTKGLVKINFFNDSRNPWHSIISDGYIELNIPHNKDVNGVSQIGVTQVPGYVYQGERMSTSRAYLERKDVQRTLKVAKNTFCTGVIIDEKDIALGVTVLPSLETYPLTVFARNEVILSAGAIGTPQILMLSGIGPAEHLEEMGIPLRKDLPVGNNMTDHVFPLIFLLVDRGIDIIADMVHWAKKGQHLVEYLMHHHGPVTSNGLTDVTVFANTLCYNRKLKRLENNSVDCELPNLQVIHSYIDKGIISLSKSRFQHGTNLNDDVVDQLASANVQNAMITVSAIVLRPYSQGNVRLTGNNPLDPLAIFPNYLSDSRDVDEMLRSIKILEDLVRTSEFRRYNAKILYLKLPGCPGYKKNRRRYWRCYIRYMTHAVFHSVGTCSLDSVVDSKLRVKGIKDLRVADASVFPLIPRGNTEAPTIAVGERVVDFIKETLKIKTR